MLWVSCNFETFSCPNSGWRKRRRGTDKQRPKRLKRTQSMDGHRGVRGKGERNYRTPPPRQISKHLLIKIATKTQSGENPLAIFYESLDPPPHPLENFAETSGTPSPGFSTCVHLWHKMTFFLIHYLLITSFFLF